MKPAKDKLLADLAEDKEYLRNCFADPLKWWTTDERCITVARILNRWGRFTSKGDVIDFFEKPYKFEDEMRFIVEEM